MSTIAVLRTLLTADSAEFNKGLKDAEKQAEGWVSRVSRTLSLVQWNAGLQIAQQAERAGEAMLRFAKGSLEAADAVGDASAAVGLSAKTFQELQHAVSFSDISADEFTTSMQKFADVSGNAIAGNKEAQASFTKLGISVRDAAGHVKTQDQLVNEAITALGSYGSEAERASAATDLLGRAAGPKFAAFAAQGIEAIDGLRKQAATFSDEQIALASQVNDEWERLTATIGIKLKSAFIDVIAWSGKFVSGSLPELNNQLGQLQGQIDEIKKLTNPSEGELNRLKAIEEQYNAVAAARDKALKTQHENSPEARDARAQASELARLHQEAVAENEKLNKKRVEDSKAAAKKAADDAAAEGKRVLEDKQRGLAKEAQAIDAYRQDQIDKEKARVETQRQMEEDYWREATRNAADASAKIQEQAQHRFDEMAKYGDTFAVRVGDAFNQAANGGKNAFELIEQAFLATLQQMLIDFLIVQPLQGFFKGLTQGQAVGSDGAPGQNATGQVAGAVVKGGLAAIFGGFFADGGNLPAGKVGIVGEAGPELVSGPAHITPMGSAPVNVVVNNNAPNTVAKTRQNQNGDLEVLVESVVAKSVSRGKVGKSMKGNFGVTRDARVAA